VELEAEVPYVRQDVQCERGQQPFEAPVLWEPTGSLQNVGKWLSEEAGGLFNLGVIDATNYPATCVIDIGELDMKFDSATGKYKFADSSRRKDVEVAHDLNLPRNASSGGGGGGGGRRQLPDGYAYDQRAEWGNFETEAWSREAGKRQAFRAARYC
jgi:hypothetical protein